MFNFNEQTPNLSEKIVKDPQELLAMPDFDPYASAKLQFNKSKVIIKRTTNVKVQPCKKLYPKSKKEIELQYANEIGERFLKTFWGKTLNFNQ